MEWLDWEVVAECDIEDDSFSLYFYLQYCCEHCGAYGRLHFHHFIYSDECITIGKWLCPKCHKAEHTRIEADE